LSPSLFLPHSPISPRLKWIDAHLLGPHQRPNLSLWTWLCNTDSLTARLVAKSQGAFQVEIQRQVIAIPSLSEQRLLGQAHPKLALIREVVLLGHGQPWVFARSVLPLESLNGKLRHLRKQDKRPLGAFLFSQPELRRSAIAVAQIRRHHNYVPDTLIQQDSLWGRRSVFYVEDKPLLVSEVFLPAFLTQLSKP
jgi:chorismate lyase